MQVRKVGEVGCNRPGLPIFLSRGWALASALHIDTTSLTVINGFVSPIFSTKDNENKRGANNLQNEN